MYDSTRLREMPLLRDIAGKQLSVSLVDTVNYRNRMKGKLIEFGATGELCELGA